MEEPRIILTGGLENRLPSKPHLLSPELELVSQNQGMSRGREEGEGYS